MGGSARKGKKMSLNINKVILGGRLTSDAELKTTPNGIFVTSFTLAVDRRLADKKTDFITVIAWRQTAEFITKYFRKGSALCIVGNIQTRTWTAQDGSKRYATEVIAEEAYFVENNKSGTEPVQTVVETKEAQKDAPKYVDITDDELPF